MIFKLGTGVIFATLMALTNIPASIPTFTPSHAPSALKSLQIFLSVTCKIIVYSVDLSISELSEYKLNIRCISY